ncbi:aldose epimerase family protein [Sphingomonas kyungheensis]|uniref:Aldose 1-epimerase n=1 Tax=Sphingomonas kyungheensis TaxID=1069987 RepID=A0ABU8H0M5_9SPHN
MMILLPLAAIAAATPPADPTITLRNAHGMVVRLIPQGAIVTAVEVPDRDGHRANVVLGYPTPADYRAKIRKNGFGATIGRYAGRIGGARFAIDGRPVTLVANDGANALHGGGPQGFDTVDWTPAAIRRDSVRFTLVSPDGFQNFPGRLTVSVTYRLADDDALHIDYRAQTTRPTVLNLTNHSYFNLAGESSGSVDGQYLQLRAARLVDTDAGGIPSGRFTPVAGTPFDFRCPHTIGERIAQPPLTPRGYNHAWLFDKPAGTLAPVARLVDPGSGRTLTIETTEPSIQAYTGGYIDGSDAGPGGHVYRPGDGIALEMQHLADSPNQPSFPSTRLRPGETYRQTTIWRFGVAAKGAPAC